MGIIFTFMGISLCVECDVSAYNIKVRTQWQTTPLQVVTGPVYIIWWCNFYWDDIRFRIRQLTKTILNLTFVVSDIPMLFCCLSNQITIIYIDYFRLYYFNIGFQVDPMTNWYRQSFNFWPEINNFYFIL